MSNFDISGAVFNDQLRMLETTDPAHADIVPLIQISRITKQYLQLKTSKECIRNAQMKGFFCKEEFLWNY